MNKKTCIVCLVFYIGYRIYKRRQQRSREAEEVEFSPWNPNFLRLEAMLSSSKSQLNPDKANKAFLFVVTHWRTFVRTLSEPDFILTMYQMFADGLSPNYVYDVLFPLRNTKTKNPITHSVLLKSLVQQSAMWNIYPLFYFTVRAMLCCVNSSYFLDVVVVYQEMFRCSFLSRQNETTSLLQSKWDQCMQDVLRYHKEEKQRIQQQIHLFLLTDKETILNSILECLYGSLGCRS